MAWVQVRSIFTGGTAEAKKLYGKRIKAVKPLNGASFNPDGQGSPVSLRINEEGYVGYPVGKPQDQIVLGFARVGALPPTMDTLMRSANLKTAVVNWPTFMDNFQIET